MVVVGALRNGLGRSVLEEGVHDPVPPWGVAVLTVLGAAFLAWRVLTQEVVISSAGLVVRNMSSTVRLHWSTIEELRRVDRPGLSVIEVHLRGTRRKLHMGAATRWNDDSADEVAGLIASHPISGDLFEVARS